MSRDGYLRAIRLAGDWVRGSYPVPIRLERARAANVSVGIYFLCDVWGRLRYIGSACRPADPHGVGRRIHEHPPVRRANWRWAWILPLRGDTPREVVETIEGRLIAALDPPDNRRRHTPRGIPVRRAS